MVHSAVSEEGEGGSGGCGRESGVCLCVFVGCLTWSGGCQRVSAGGVCECGKRCVGFWARLWVVETRRGVGGRGGMTEDSAGMCVRVQETKKTGGMVVCGADKGWREKACVHV